MNYESFFRYARFRHEAHVNRVVLSAPPPWTTDPTIQKHRFTNIYRELDRTTEWLRVNVREPILARDESRVARLREVFLATIVFRAFCRIETGRALFCQQQLNFDGSGSAWDMFRFTGATKMLRSEIIKSIPSGPWVTGAYMIRSPSGMTKLDGVLHNLQTFWHKTDWREIFCQFFDKQGRGSMRELTRWLQGTPGHGPFLAYEVVCDLRYTPLLESASDRFTWANVGPGALRGLSRLHDRTNPNPRKPKYANRVSIPDAQAQSEMQSLLLHSTDPELWPYQSEYPMWEMREVEHTLCEYDKWMRSQKGDGRMKRKFSP